ncbi:GAP1-N2 domain-containing protein [Actinomadura madurae]|uniref:GAP1-N2 domain-containing protein n=1 Tax=Actinomadura madurae TaxID=1993 RepID=UPI0020D20F32|nr:GTPase [Actinomadura madurae]MCQ0010454.1 50S ribosome-binding GTPase [Actinomadura madurae]
MPSRQGITCPYCFASVAPQRILFRCRGRAGRRQGCAPVLDEKLAEYTGSTAGASLPPVFAASGRKGRAGCPECGVPTGNRACPECHNPLPAAYCDSPGRIVALVGAKNAGKSTYIAVLLHELMNRVGTELDASLVACDDRTIERYKRDFARPLLEERRLLPTTASAATGPREPLVYLLTRTRRGRFSRPRNDSLALVLFDTAGEDLRSREATDLHLRYLEAADAIIFLVDPLELPGARTQVRDTVPGPPAAGEDPGSEPLNIIARVTETLRQRHGTRPGEPLPVPVAVALTKIDVLRPGAAGAVGAAPVAVRAGRPRPGRQGRGARAGPRAAARLAGRAARHLPRAAVRRPRAVRAVGARRRPRGGTGRRGRRPPVPGRGSAAVAPAPVRDARRRPSRRRVAVAWQLHYTSARRGPTGRAGFQFVAETPGLPDGVRAAVTPHLSYRPPPDAPPAPATPSSTGSPSRSCTTGWTARPLLLRCRYLGRDYSGRYGNFFAHAVVAEPAELEGLRPAELWHAPLWAPGPAQDDRLAELEELTPDDTLSPEALARWLASSGLEAPHRTLALLTDAAVKVLEQGHGRLVLIADHVETIARWIALITYSLPVDTAARLTFTTYSADPDAAAQSLVGTTTGVWSATRTQARDTFAVNVEYGFSEFGTEPSLFGRIVAACWRRADFAGLDCLGELTLLDPDEGGRRRWSGPRPWWRSAAGTRGSRPPRRTPRRCCCPGARTTSRSGCGRSWPPVSRSCGCPCCWPSTTGRGAPGTYSSRGGAHGVSRSWP